jgi:hypothetical protein
VEIIEPASPGNGRIEPREILRPAANASRKLYIRDR